MVTGRFHICSPTQLNKQLAQAPVHPSAQGGIPCCPHITTPLQTIFSTPLSACSTHLSPALSRFTIRSSAAVALNSLMLGAWVQSGGGGGGCVRHTAYSHASAAYQVAAWGASNSRRANDSHARRAAAAECRSHGCPAHPPTCRTLDSRVEVRQAACLTTTKSPAHAFRSVGACLCACCGRSSRIGACTRPR